MDFDLIVIGAGPNGLCFARSLADSGLKIALIDQQPRATLAEAEFDGREIALTAHSVELMKRLGVWEHIPEVERHPLRAARVLDGNTRDGIEIQPEAGERGRLGWLVPNHLIRRAAYAAVDGQQDLHWFDGVRPIAVEARSERAEVQLDDGRLLRARLLVAADSRFSETRRALGVAADMEDFGKTMLVCRMQHEIGHQNTAWEWFGHGQTLALLPLGDNTASAVLTLPQVDIQRLQALDDAAFGAEITRRFDGRLGRMQPIGTRHAYPLVGVYPRQFVGTRFALIGDAAVGMHPVTAHGFNFGLLGVDLLAQRIRCARAAGLDIANARDLAGYQRDLRRATRPLYLATRAIARLYTCDSAPARPFRRALANALSASGDSRAQTRPLTRGLRALF